MRGIKTSKITAIGLMVLALGFELAISKELPTLQNYIEGEMRIVGGYPKVGEIFDVVYRIKIKEINETPIKDYLTRDYCAVIRCGPSEAINVLGEDKFFFSGFRVGEWQEFRTRCRILKPMERINIDGNVDLMFQGKSRGPVAVKGQMTIFLIDPKTGQYGTREEYEKRLREDASWWYDPAGEFTNEAVSPDCAARNREIIAQMKKLEPNLTDWEALYLHYDGIQALMGGMGDGKTTWEDRWRFLLEMGWLERQRAGKEVKEKWLKEIIEKYKGKPLIKEQGLNPNFFRDNSDSIGNNPGSPDSTQKRWDYFYLDGQFRYKKHQYNKDQGLLTQTVDMPICSVLVRIRTYWSGQGTIWSYRDAGDENGCFACTLSWEVPVNINIYAHPMIYFWGPSRTDLKIKVSDPTPTSYITWRDPLDTTIFLLPRIQGGVDTIWTGTNTYDFGTMYVDSFKLSVVTQPKSGAANISQTYRHARTFMSPPLVWSLRIL